MKNEEKKIVKISDGVVDLSKFEICLFNDKNICKIIRDGNEKPNQRKRTAYDGPQQAIFHECE